MTAYLLYRYEDDQDYNGHVVAIGTRDECRAYGESLLSIGFGMNGDRYEIMPISGFPSAAERTAKIRAGYRMYDATLDDSGITTYEALPMLPGTVGTGHAGMHVVNRFGALQIVVGCYIYTNNDLFISAYLDHAAQILCSYFGGEWPSRRMFFDRDSETFNVLRNTSVPYFDDFVRTLEAA